MKKFSFFTIAVITILIGITIFSWRRGFIRDLCEYISKDTRHITTE